MSLSVGGSVVDVPVRVRIAVLIAATATVAAATAARLTVSYDLAAFLPGAATAEQQVLKERFGQGPGAQAIYAVLPNTSAATADTVAAQLRGNPLVKRVLSRAPDVALTDVPQVLTASQFLLADLPVAHSGWREVLEARLADAMLGDEDLIALIAADPLLAAANALESAAESAPRFGFGADRYLLIVGSLPAFDGGAQTHLVDAIRTVARDAGIPNIALYGPGVYSADLQDAVRAEATWFSLLAGCGLVGLLLWRFRSVEIVAAISTPMLLGAAVGALAVSLVFGPVHGIAIAFGFTLLGVAVDYPLHTFSHAAHPHGVWPTLRIGVATTAVGYAGFLFGGSPGLAQLGLFAVVGLASAALATAWMRTNQAAATDVARHGRRNKPARLANWPWALVLAVAVSLLLLRSPFSDDLGALTPVAPVVLAADAEIRERMGASDMRHLVAVQDEDLEIVLRNTEAVGRRLDEARANGALRGYQHVARLLPSAAAQQRRQEGLDRFLADGGTAFGSPFATAAQSIGYAADAFEPFHARALAAAAEPHLLTRESLRADADLAAFLDAHLYRANGVWKSLVFLRGIADLDAIVQQLEVVPNVEVLDLKRASTSLVGDFRLRLGWVLGCALIAMAALLWFLTRDMRRSAWVLGTVVAAVAMAAAATATLRGAVSPFDLMALALVGGLALDYSLFCSKPAEHASERADTRRAVGICAASSLLVFGLVSFSSIPALSGIGTTVAGASLAATCSLGSDAVVEYLLDLRLDRIEALHRLRQSHAGVGGISVEQVPLQFMEEAHGVVVEKATPSADAARKPGPSPEDALHLQVTRRRAQKHGRVVPHEVHVREFPGEIEFRGEAEVEGVVPKQLRHHQVVVSESRILAAVQGDRVAEEREEEPLVVGRPSCIPRVLEQRDDVAVRQRNEVAARRVQGVAEDAGVASGRPAVVGEHLAIADGVVLHDVMVDGLPRRDGICDQWMFAGEPLQQERTSPHVFEANEIGIENQPDARGVGRQRDQPEPIARAEEVVRAEASRPAVAAASPCTVHAPCVHIELAFDAKPDRMVVVTHRLRGAETVAKQGAPPRRVHEMPAPEGCFRSAAGIAHLNAMSAGRQVHRPHRGPVPEYPFAPTFDRQMVLQATAVQLVGRNRQRAARPDFVVFRDVTPHRLFGATEQAQAEFTQLALLQVGC